MTDKSTLSGTAGGVPPRENPEGANAIERDAQRLARLTGFLFLVTYVTSIPALFVFYAPALNDPAFVLGEGFSRSIAVGAILEMVLIAANIGTALTIYPVLRRSNEILAPGYVAARIVESGLIAVGIVALMALNTLRDGSFGFDRSVMTAVGAALVAVHDWTFRLGPGVVVGVGNGLILGWMMWRARLVPRALSALGLIGGLSLLLAGLAVMLGRIEAGSTAQVIATVPEFFWELILGIWLLVRGFDRSALERHVRR
jgi:hypothetical protein